MRKKEIIKAGGIASMIGGASLILWWVLMPLILPVADSAENFQHMVLHTGWIPVNAVGLVAILILILGFPASYILHFHKFGKLSLFGFVFAITGLILYTCIQYYETFIWPAAAQIEPALVELRGALVFGDPAVVAALFVSGGILGIGYILYGIALLKSGSFPKLPVWFLIIGAPVFGLGLVLAIRTVGLILFGAGTIWLGNYTRKHAQE